MSIKQINSLRHRHRDGELWVWMSVGPHRGWVRKSFLIQWLKKRGLLRTDSLI